MTDRSLAARKGWVTRRRNRRALNRATRAWLCTVWDTKVQTYSTRSITVPTR